MFPGFLLQFFGTFITNDQQVSATCFYLIMNVVKLFKQRKTMITPMMRVKSDYQWLIQKMP